MEKFFRNLLLDEHNELKNRYLVISPPEGLTGQVPDKLMPDDPRVHLLVSLLGNHELTVKEMMTLIDMKHRETFLNNYLNPAIQTGFVRLLYPESPRHPRQKYLLTVRGLTAYQEIKHGEQ